MKTKEDNVLEFMWKIIIVIFIMTSSTVMMNKITRLEKRLAVIEQTLEIK